jgi:hypothetical protein
MMIIKPNLSSQLNIYSYLGGVTKIKSLEPSRGGIGIKLNIANAILINIKV